ncbi:MAG: enoyl-CoA hydratase/isomerase family protein [Chitinophagales bacterium]|nr:enoyl-CoA hydratase/isomerase family protein [Chitinophagales bacterium]
MAYQWIEYKIEDRIAYIILNRPEKRNAFNEALVNELKQAFIAAENDTEVKVVVLAAHGKAFSAGADLDYLQGLQKNSYEENLADSNNLKELYQHIYSYKKIVIAKVQGHAIAGGAGLATVCDFCYSVPEALFGYTEVKIGFIPAIVMVFLLQKISGTKAKELLLTGKLISAAEALEIGLINQLVEAGHLDKEVHSFAMELCQSVSAQSIENTKKMLLQLRDMDLDQAFSYAAEMNAKGRETADCKKGIASFLSKEKLSW